MGSAVDKFIPETVKDNILENDFGRALIGPAAFHTGGATGAALATGNDPEQAALADVAGLGAGIGLGASGLVGTPTAAGSSGVGGLKAGAGAGEVLGVGGGSSIPASGLSIGPESSALMGVGGTPTVPAAGLNVSPAAMSAFGAGSSLPFAAASGISQGGPGMAFSGGGAAPAGAGATTGGLVAPGVPGAGVSSAATAPGAASAAQQPSFMASMMKQMQDNALALGLIGGSTVLSLANQPKMPGQQEMAGMSAEAKATADQLLQQYRSGQISAGQQAGLDQLTRQTKNQVTQYFSSIGQADSTAHQQALAQVDQQALGMRQQMLDNMLQQGLNAIGVASGPLNSIAQYQMGQDAALRQAFGNFAQATGTLLGRGAGSTVPPAPQPQQNTQPAQPVSSAQPNASFYSN